MKRPDEKTREYLRRLEAQLPDHKDVFRLMNTLYLDELKEKAVNSRTNTGKVGIWKAEDGQYVLDETTAAEWNYWSKMTTIPKKSTKKRVVFLGESVARGYFYDPFYNTCIELNNLFGANGKDDYEVVDLARTDLNYEMLLQLIEETTALEPDVVVIFGGNNWDCSELWLSKPLDIADCMKNGGMKAVLEYFNQSLVGQVKNMYDCLNNLFMKRGIPVVFVIPEFNLLDWEDTDVGQPWDVNTNQTEWLDYMSHLKQLFADKKYEQVIHEALEYSDVKQKMSVRELNLLAKAYKALGNRQEEQNCKKRARDIAVLYPKINTPRTVSSVQEALKKEAENYTDLVTVDCREVFCADRNEVDRTLFMDYCHLTMHGIQLVMKEVYQKILELNHEQADITGNDRNCTTEENNRVMAEAHFLAAIHNAHWGQDAEIVKYHLQKACEYDAAIKSVLKEFAFFQNRTLPVWMSKHSEAYLNGISEQRQRYLSKNKGLALDKVLIDSIKSVVEDAGFEADFQSALIRTYGIHEKDKNLLEPDYYVKAISMTEAQYNWPEIPARLKRYGYFAAYSDTSDFWFVSDQSRAYALKIVARIPGDPNNSQKFRIILNETVVYEGDITSEWQKHEIAIPVEAVAEGYNALQLQWPDYSDNTAEQAEQIGVVLEKRRTPDIIPVYGEVYTLSLENKEKI